MPPSTNPQSQNNTTTPIIDIDLGDLFPADPVATTSITLPMTMNTTNVATIPDAITQPNTNEVTINNSSEIQSSVISITNESSPTESPQQVSTISDNDSVTSISTPIVESSVVSTVSPISSTSTSSANSPSATILDINLSDLVIPPTAPIPSDQTVNDTIIGQPETPTTNLIATDLPIESVSNTSQSPLESSNFGSNSTNSSVPIATDSTISPVLPVSSDSPASNDDPFSLDIDLSSIELDEVTPVAPDIITTPDSSTAASTTTDATTSMNQPSIPAMNQQMNQQTTVTPQQEAITPIQTPSIPAITTSLVADSSNETLGSVITSSTQNTEPSTTDNPMSGDIGSNSSDLTSSIATVSSSSLPVPSLIASELEHDHPVPGLNSNPFDVGTKPLIPSNSPGGINIDAMLGSLGTTVEQLQPAPITLITQQPLLVTPAQPIQTPTQMRLQAVSMNNIYKIIFILLIAGIGLGAYYSVTNPVEFDLLVSNILGTSQDGQNLTTPPSVFDNTQANTGSDANTDANNATTGEMLNSGSNNTGEINNVSTGSTNTGGSANGSISSGTNSGSTIYTGLDEVLKPGILQDQWNERIAGYLLKVKTLVDESRLQKNKEAAKQSITLQKSLQQLQETIKSDSYDAQKVNSQLDSVQATLGEIKALLNDPLSQDDKTL